MMFDLIKFALFGLPEKKVEKPKVLQEYSSERMKLTIRLMDKTEHYITLRGYNYTYWFDDDELHFKSVLSVFKDWKLSVGKMGMIELDNNTCVPLANVEKIISGPIEDYTTDYVFKY
jgi:hypothetical protein